MLAFCWHSTPAYYAFYDAGIFDAGLPGTADVDGHPVSVKVDTGAEITALSDTIWNSPANLERAEFFGPNQRQLNVLAQKSLNLASREIV